ncbi:MAG: TonB-dependent receptor, partial [Pseudomonadota bacterium]
MKPTLARRAGSAGRQRCRNGFASFAALTLAGIAPLAATAQNSDESNIEEVVTTGTRLTANPNLASGTPVLSVTGEEGMTRGNVRIEDFVNVLPQVFAGQASEVSNGATGTATLNLRGLGSVRTLVLIDGRRLPYGSSGIASANVDIVPLQMLERVDILTGGASAVYGSDAVGGVANFILKRDFEGVEVGGQYGASYSDNDDGFWQQVLEAGNQPVPGSEWDGEETLFYAMMGANTDDGRGNVTLFMSYEDRQEITQDNRIYSGCALGQDTGDQSFGGFGCVGSANFRAFGGDGGFGFQEESGEIVPFVGGPAQTFNFGPFNFFQRPSERYNLYAKGHYGISDKIEAFADFSYTNNFSDAQIAPSASFGTWNINCDNPLANGTPGLDIAVDLLGCTPDDIANGVIKAGSFASHRNVEGGPRNSRLENSAWRVVAGLRGSFADDIWGWETFIQNSETRDSTLATNDFIVANVQQSFLAVDDGTGNVVCQDTSGGCIPYNIFQRGPNGESLVTQDQLDYLLGPSIVNGSTSQFVWGGTLQADLGEYGWSLPTADGGVGVLFGLEYRKDELVSNPDQITQTPGGGFTGVGGATLSVAGELDVQEIFTEIEVPLLSGMTLAEELTFRGQYRYSHYETEGNDVENQFSAEAYGYSLAWAPIEDLRVRAGYQRAVRAPNVIELYTGQNTGLPNLSVAGTNSQGVQLFDPCASVDPIRSLADCQNTGVTAAQYGSIQDVISGQAQSLTGGNPRLDPEVADTYTFGFVYTPSWASGLSISVDYFDITVEGAVQAGIPAQVILDNCLDSGDPTFCQLINRGPRGTLASGSPVGSGFQLTNVNIGELATTGLDFQIIYNFDIGDHNLNIDYASTVLDTLDTVPFPGADPIERAGKFGNAVGASNPEYRHRIVGTWTTPWPVDFSMTWRHFGETDNDNETDTLETTLDAVNYVDLAAIWTVMDQMEVSVSVSLS